MQEPVAVYADGGVVEVNPSPLAGVWAFCTVAADGLRLHESSGVILPYEVLPDPVRGQVVTNNHAEFYAVMKALTILPDGWSGSVCSDSQVTLDRISGKCRLQYLPQAWIEQVSRQLRRLGTLEYVYLKGHPTRKALTRGTYGDKQMPVSIHNVWCDQACQREAQRFKRFLKGKAK